MTEKLETPLEKVEIKQTRDKTDPIRFRDDAINKVKKQSPFPNLYLIKLFLTLI